MKKFGILKEEKEKHPLDVAPPFKGKPDAEDFKKLRDDKENVDENLELEEGSCGSHDKDLEESSCMGKKRLNEEEEEEDHEELTRKKENGIPLSPEEEERLARYNNFDGAWDEDEWKKWKKTRMAEPDETLSYKPRGIDESKEECRKCKADCGCKKDRVAESRLLESMRKLEEVSKVLKKLKGRK